VHESRQGSNYEVTEMVGVKVVRACLYLTRCTVHEDLGITKEAIL
jgi:hypothetical protein